DTDMDSSDVMALPYLLAQEGRQVLAVTVPATGVAHCPAGAVHAAAIVQLMERDVPVACGSGADEPNVHPFPDWLRALADNAYGLRLPAPQRPPLGDAVALLASTLSAAERPVTVLTLGPLTNLAQLIEQHPDLTPRIGRLVIMGGAFDVAGNVDANAAVGAPEWNIWADPTAARTVVRSGIQLTMVPLDATDDVPMTGAFVGQLERRHDRVAADLAYELMVRNPVLSSGGQFFWDQLTTVALDYPEVLRAERRRATVEADGADAGRTRRDDSGTDIEVAIGADPDGFMTAFLGGLQRGPTSRSPFALRTSFEVGWDGSTCSAASASPAQTGAASVRFSDATGAAGLFLVTLHDHSWRDLETFAEHFAPGMAAPDFVGVTPIQARSPLPEVVDIDAAGTVGFACLTLNGSDVTGVTLSRSFDVAAGQR
ncbi:MAG TPA: nucleoside hydrolase, partial [Candidatus Limnocylindria bacterium]|nr:nucleoside hydrolase [Candidatus Limnocylindria bacterium]